MTEHDWRECPDPKPMLDFVASQATDRQLRLFAAGCCRRVWHLLTDDRSRNAVDVAERYADGVANLTELQSASVEAVVAWRAVEGPALDGRQLAGLHAAMSVPAAVATSLQPSRFVFFGHHTWQGGSHAAMADAAASQAAVAIGYTVEFWGLRQKRQPAEATERKTQVDLVRCVFGDPFRRVAIDPARPTSTVVQLAQAAYDDRLLPEGTLDPARLGVLASALEAAGCTDAELLGHLRSEGPHVRGCWAVDAILGRS